ncbi:uncharacterized protein BDV14DRAFT_172107 [Aspergillus stella-maris]|uniref:uncharacterized protein n=1 Tax=Aspergillus stella-maris TaxID=1810926 RepID=UPI003CCCC685
MAKPVPPLFPRAPNCCDIQMSCRRTKSDRNGNKGRWFYECKKCDDMVFDDWEDIRHGNPLCDCQELSRRQIMDDSVVFRCARNRCKFGEEHFYA